MGVNVEGHEELPLPHLGVFIHLSIVTCRIHNIYSGKNNVPLVPHSDVN